MTSARAFWATAPGVGEIRTDDLPDPAAGEVRVRCLTSGVSRGTEALVFAGRVPPNQHDAMRAPLMGGAFPFPVKYGYCAVGVLADGQRVFVLHPHQDVFNAPAGMCVPVPDAVPDRRAVLSANMETAVNIVWDAAPLVGERIMVIGAGVVGLLTASLLSRVPGTVVTVVDTDPSRASLVARFATPDDAPGKIAGIEIARPNGGFLGLQIVNNNFVLSFYDAKKKKIPPDVARAALRWPVKYPPNAQLYTWGVKNRKDRSDITRARFVVVGDPWEPFALDKVLGSEAARVAPVN